MSKTTSAQSTKPDAKIMTGFDRKVRLTHLITLLAISAVCLYAIFFLILHFYILSAFSFGIVIALAGVQLLNRFHYFNAARISLFLIANLFIFYLGSSLGHDSNIRALYFPLFIGIFILFDFKEVFKVFIVFNISLVLLIWGEATHYKIFLIPSILPDQQSVISIATFFGAVTASLLFIYYLITISSNSEKFLETERNNTKAIIDNTNDVIMLINTKYEILAMNNVLAQAFKRSGDKSRIGSNIVELINENKELPQHFKDWSTFIDRAFAGERVMVENKHILPNAEVRYLETSFNPVLQDGKASGAAIFIHDISATKLLEEKILRLNAQQTAIIEGANYSIISIGLDGLVSSFNRGSEKMLGYTAEEAIGKLGPHDIISKKQLVASARALSMELGRPVSSGFDIFVAKAEIGEEVNEWVVTTKTGNKLILSSSITALKNDDGTVFGYLIISTDITEKKHVEEQLNAAAEEDRKRVWINTGIAEMGQLLRVRENDHVKFYTTVLTFVSKYVGAGQSSLFKVMEDEKGINFLEQVAGYATEPGKSKRAYQFGESLVGQVALEQKSMELKGIPADYLKINSSLGEAKPSQILITPLLFQNDLIGVLEMASLKDFTETEKEFIEKANAVFAASIDLMNRRAKTDDLLKETLEMNERLKTQEEELRVGNEELMEKGDLLQASEEELRVQQEELMHTNAEMEEKTNLLEEQNAAMALRNEELESARAALKIKAEELEVISRYKSEFLANMSHELRTPLNSILILSKLLGENKENPLTPKQVEFTNVIQRSGADLLNLINDILDLSKIESRKIDLEIEAVPIADIQYTMESLFRELAKEKEIQLRINIEPGLASEFTGDKVRTEQILKNLLSNAFKFTPKLGTVDLNILHAGNGFSVKNPYLIKSAKNICFQVKDSGIGISEEKQQLIFEAFRQADGSTSRKYGGTGLGLSISKELALILGGELQLESEPAKGSSFTLILPMVFDPNSAASNDVASSFKIESEVSQDQDIISPDVPILAKDNDTYFENKKPETKPIRLKKLILIIEDDIQFGKILKKQAQEKGFDAKIATRGDEGLEKIRELLPDAILLDIGLPGMNGWEVMQKMKEEPQIKDIPVHIISGNGIEKKLIQESPAVEFLEKPIKTDQLNALFEKMSATKLEKQQLALIIEDSEIQTLVLKKAFANKGIECVFARTGEEAFERISDRIPDLIVTDLNLPDISGMDLIKKIKLDPDLTQINIIIYTGKELNRKENEELSRYSDAIIVKSAKSQDRLLDETTLFLKKVREEKASEFPTLKTRKSFTDQASLKGKKILLVDDDMRNIFALSKALEESELMVVVANDGKEALKKLSETEGIDLVLMDIMMPEMDGYEATAKIKMQDQYKNLPIIALTAKAMKGDREKSIEAGASDYISKPVDVNKLMSLIRVWLS